MLDGIRLKWSLTIILLDRLWKGRAEFFCKNYKVLFSCILLTITSHYSISWHSNRSLWVVLMCSAICVYSTVASNWCLKLCSPHLMSFKLIQILPHRSLVNCLPAVLERGRAAATPIHFQLEPFPSQSPSGGVGWRDWQTHRGPVFLATFHAAVSSHFMARLAQQTPLWWVWAY